MAQILVADDEADLRELLRETLEAEGHTVTVVRNGQEAIIALDDPSRKFDLVVTDMYMPERDGLEVVMHCSRQKIAVIAMSGGGNSRAAGYDALPSAQLMGAITTVHKPFTLDYMCKIVEAVLARTT